jgi:antitoxin HicB
MEGHAMRTFVYSARFEPGEKRGIVVSFPDVPEAITQGDDEADAHAQAEEALGLALLTYPARGLPLPRARARAGLVLVAVEPEIVAKLAVMDAVRAAGISKSEFARRIGKDEKEARRILDPKHPTKLATLAEALRKLGQRLVIGVEPAERSVAVLP